MNRRIKETEDAIFVYVDGKIDYETQAPLKDELRQIVQDNKNSENPKQVIFNFEQLEFVGSCGISNFVQTLKDFNRISTVKPKYCSVRNEFQRVIKAFDTTESFEFFENETGALNSFSTRASSRHDH
jgi:anti-anti-sigma factor